ncbi:protein angel homolog 1 isoform X2 [Seriola aureovittata]|uniref:protein angel homolog 1 isoform X2 n=1 Tax=Seriola aureovittata TaxID=2871759 RepID=UPI0024BE207D|nr:protein angel homolog 1 isoform X2 [Seriola aureovittata]
MIGSLLFYALYPLSRYFTGRRSEASKKGLPLAVVNGRSVWDGGAVTTRTFIQSRTTLPDLWLSQSRWTKGETKERMKEQSPEKEVDARIDTDKEQLVAVLREETENETVKMSEMQHNTVEVPKQEDVSVLHRKQNTEGISPEQALEAQLKCLQTDESIQETACAVLEQIQMHTMEESVTPVEGSTQDTICSAEVQIQMHSLGELVSPAEDSTQDTICSAEVQKQIHSLEELVTPAEDSTQETTCSAEAQIQSLRKSVTPAEDSIQETTCLVQRQIQIPSVEESVTPSVTVDKITECWDEYLAPSAHERHGGENSSKLVFTSLLSNNQTHLKFTGQHDTQTGWHFAAGPGLAEEVQCPLWQFPTVSYYPPTEPTVPFEVMWRVWEEVDESAATAEPALVPFPFTKMYFTVMSYNILAQDLLEANQELYIHCPLDVLDWSYRCNLLLEEILKWAPDILCLQEVQENHYHEQLYPVLSQMGYTCVYKRRTGTKTDGCATCYRNSCFAEVSVTPLEYFRPETDLLDRHNVGIVLLLRPVVTQASEAKVKGPLLCVANTHLLFNPRRGDVKLAQLAIMLAEIDSTVKSCKAKGEHCNVVLCGDFNSVPHMPLYQLITTGELYYQGLPSWMISGQEDLSYKTHCYRLFAPLWPSCLAVTDSCQYTTVNNMFESQSQKSGKCQYTHDFMLQLRYCPAACVRPVDLNLIPGVTDNTPDASRGNQPYEKRFRHTISHHLDLESVYKHVLPGSGSSEVTTLHSEVGATVDYIFYSPRRTLTSAQKDGGDFLSEGLKLIGSLSLLSEDVVWSMRGLPNHIFPSDHLSLMAKFQLDLNAA